MQFEEKKEQIKEFISKKQVFIYRIKNLEIDRDYLSYIGDIEQLKEIDKKINYCKEQLRMIDKMLDYLKEQDMECFKIIDFVLIKKHGIYNKEFKKHFNFSSTTGAKKRKKAYKILTDYIKINNINLSL